MVLLALLAAPAAAMCTESTDLVVHSELFLGRERRGVPFVGPLRWRHFLVSEVTPRFSGFTVLNATGYWENARERSRVLVIEHAAAQQAEVEAIAEAYRRTFEQEAVLLVSRSARGVLCVDEAVVTQDEGRYLLTHTST